MSQEYAIIDIETTGRSQFGQKVTEIAIIVHDGEKVIDEYQTLVNPETSIPYSITQLTGIHDEMVMHAPKFYEVARKIHELTEDRVFVAHNVAFDFGVLKSEFSALGGKFEREQLCTVKLSRKLLPDHASYSLGKLCNDLGISITARHRAFGDAEATVKLLEILFDKAKAIGLSDKLTLDSVSEIPKIPPLLDPEVFKNLPKAVTGVYYIYDQSDTLIYIGKANDIRQRMLSHFNDKSRKERNMFAETANIKYESTGSELIALLLESDEIKKHKPKYNRALKQTKSTHGLYTYDNQEGILQLSIGKIVKGSFPIISFATAGQANNFLEKIVEEYSLCPKYCGLEKTNGSCFASMIKKCNGVCRDKESVEDYNERVSSMLSNIILKNEDFFVIGLGRTTDELGIVQIRQGQYIGYGYVPKKDQNNNHVGYENFITPKVEDRDSQRIIISYLRKYGAKTKLQP